MIRRRIETVATSNADDAEFGALADLAEVTDGIDEVCIGGHMASVRLIAFPMPEAMVRRTADADAAVSTSVAAAGQIHRALVEAGYADTSGNHYIKGDLAIDIAVPSGGTVRCRITSSLCGGTHADALPWLRLWRAK